MQKNSTRSLTRINRKYLYINPLHKSDILNDLKIKKDRNIGTDIIIKVQGREIVTHKKVLCDSIPYIAAYIKNLNLSINNQNTLQINLEHLNANAVRKIIDFVYAGQLALCYPDDKDILIVSDYLCMEDVNTVCANYYLNNMDLKNCIDIYMMFKEFAIRHFVYTERYIFTNSMKLLNRNILFDLSVENIQRILSSNDLLILDDEYPCISSKQEYLLLNTLIKLYLASKKSKGMSIIKLIQSVVRINLINAQQLTKIRTKCQDKNIVEAITDACKLNIISTPRALREIKFEMSQRFQNSHHIKWPLQSFDDNRRNEFEPQYVTSMKIYTKRWLEFFSISTIRNIIAGIEVGYSVGNPILHGSNNKEYEIHEFRLDEDERITSIITGRDMMCDSFVFLTNKKRKLGRYIGDKGCFHHFFPSPELGSKPYLAYLTGDIELTQDCKTVRALQFVWGCMKLDETT